MVLREGPESTQPGQLLIRRAVTRNRRTGPSRNEANRGDGAHRHRAGRCPPLPCPIGAAEHRQSDHQCPVATPTAAPARDGATARAVLLLPLSQEFRNRHSSLMRRRCWDAVALGSGLQRWHCRFLLREPRNSLGHGTQVLVLQCAVAMGLEIAVLDFNRALKENTDRPDALKHWRRWAVAAQRAQGD